jgi:hypothetical protein
MSRESVFRNRQVALLAAVLVLTAAILLLVPPPPAAAFICEGAYSYTVLYYSNSTYTTEVGECTYACDTTPRCTGTMTAWSRTFKSGCCDD